MGQRSQRAAAATEFSEAFGQRTVSEAAVLQFATLTGDYAQMHLDRDFGPANGMGGTVAHGLLSAAWSLGALTLYAPERLGVGDPALHVAHYEIRFRRMVFQGDRFALRQAPGAEALRETRFEVQNQRGEATCTGALRVAHADDPHPGPVAPLAIEPWSGEGLTEPLSAEDLPTRGPRGVGLGRTVSEADLVAWAGFTGEQNPLYLSEPFARSSPFAARIAPPMWCFCTAFGDFLRALLGLRMPLAGFAGHLGDSWRVLAAVHVGDTIRVRHKPIACTVSKSRPEMGIVRFALQIENQREEIVQDGEVAMMIPARGTGRA